MRVGYYDADGNGIWNFSPNVGVGDDYDYHWWIQLGDGRWADKRGQSSTRIIPNSTYSTNPDSLLWTTYYLGEVEHNEFYSSTPTYYKITA
jgi:hypothetical protein